MTPSQVNDSNGLALFGFFWFGFSKPNIRRIAAPEYAFVVLGGSVSNAGGSVRRNRPDGRAVPSFCPSLVDPTLPGAMPRGRDHQDTQGFNIPRVNGSSHPPLKIHFP